MDGNEANCRNKVATGADVQQEERNSAVCNRCCPLIAMLSPHSRPARRYRVTDRAGKGRRRCLLGIVGRARASGEGVAATVGTMPLIPLPDRLSGNGRLTPIRTRSYGVRRCFYRGIIYEGV